MPLYDESMTEHPYHDTMLSWNNKSAHLIHTALTEIHDDPTSRAVLEKAVFDIYKAYLDNNMLDLFVSASTIKVMLENQLNELTK